jgi:O-acetyl-ADP-ribose deacetylase (regulator of RNase III)
MRHIRVADTVILVAKGDITADNSDCVVCPTEYSAESTVRSGDVARALSLSAGREVQQEYDRWLRKNGQLSVGDVVVTRAGNLPCKQLMHAVTPGYAGGKTGEEKQLRVLLKNVLRKAEELKATTLSVPSLVQGYPAPDEARVFFEVCLEYLTSRPTCITQIRFLNFDSLTVEGFAAEFDRRFPASVGIQRYFSSESLKHAEPRSPPQHVCCMLL